MPLTKIVPRRRGAARRRLACPAGTGRPASPAAALAPIGLGAAGHGTLLAVASIAQVISNTTAWITGILAGIATLLCAERNPEVVLRVVEQMLASWTRRPTTALVGPGGQPLRSPGETADFPGAADRSRSVAAVVCLPLIEEMPGAAPRLVEALVRTLESPDHDKYDAPPSRMVGMTLGHALLRRYPDVALPLLAVAPRISTEARKALFGAVPSALRSKDLSGTPDPIPQLVQLAVDRLRGDWGEEMATEATLVLRDQARFHPERLAGHADGLVGVLITEITRPAALGCCHTGRLR